MPKSAPASPAPRKLPQLLRTVQVDTQAGISNLPLAAQHTPVPSLGAKRLDRTLTCGFSHSRVSTLHVNRTTESPKQQLKLLPAPRSFSPVKSPSTLSDTAANSTQAAFQKLRSLLQSIPDSLADLRGSTTIKAALEFLIDNKKSIVTEVVPQLEDYMVEQRTKCAALTDRLATANQEIQFLRKENAECSDYIFAADERLTLVQQQLEAVSTEKEKLQEVFDNRVHSILNLRNGFGSSLSVEQVGDLNSRAAAMASRFVNEDVDRLMKENKALRAQIAKLEKGAVERAAINERVQRLVAEHNALSSAKQESEKKIDMLMDQVRDISAKSLKAKESLEAQAQIHMQQLRQIRRQGNPLQKERLWFLLQAKTLQAVQSRVLRVWQRYVLLKKQSQRRVSNSGLSSQLLLLPSSNSRPGSRNASPSRAQSLPSAEESLTAESHSAIKRMIANFTKENDALHRRVASLNTEISQLKSQITFMKENPRTLLSSAMEGTLSASSGNFPPASTANGLLDSTELQTKALEVYNLVHPILLDIKQRLKLSIPANPLRLYTNTTDNVIMMTLNWILEHYKPLFFIISLDQKLRQQKASLTFLSLRTRPKLKRLYAQQDVATDKVFERSVIERKIVGYEEVMQRIAAVKSKIDATIQALTLCGTDEKQQEIATLASTFEADIGEFQRRLKVAESIQFQLSLELTKKAGAKQGELHRKMEGKTKTTLQGGQRAGYFGFSVNKATDPDVEGNAQRSDPPPAASSTPSKEDPKKKKLETGKSEDNFEKAKHGPGFTVHAFLSSDKDGNLSHDAFEKLKHAEAEAARIRKKCNASTDLVSSNMRLKKQMSAVKEKAKEEPLRGSLENFITHSGALIPFRSNQSKAPAVAAPDPTKSNQGEGNEPTRKSVAQQLLDIA